jgi:AraC family transcriptional regulator
MTDQPNPTSSGQVDQEPEIEYKDAFRVAGLRYEGKNEHGEIPAMWDRFIPRVGELGADLSRLVAYGIARALPPPVEEGAFEYLAGVEVESFADLPTDMVGWEIPALTYAVLPANDVPGMGPVSRYFYREWLPGSKEFQMGEELMIEVYSETYAQDRVIYLYFPVKPR